MSKPKMRSPDLVQANIAKLGKLFPACVTEARDEVKGDIRFEVDFDKLKQYVGGGGGGADSPERYRLAWPGKRDAVALAYLPTTMTLRPIRAESLQFETTKNLFIEGDNLQVLKLIQESYLGKIKVICIDPPYNTGKDLIYRDSFGSNKVTKEIEAEERTEEGERLVANPESNGKFHTNWLNMMAPRLRLAKNLLTLDGAIFVSCDEGEQPRLRLMMDEIFGQSNFVADLVWAAGRKNDSRLVSVSHEYIVCYARETEYLRENQVTWRQRKKGLDEICAQHDRLKRRNGNDYSAMMAGMKEWYRSLPDSHPSKAHRHYAHVDSRGIYFPDNISWPGGGGPKYQVLHPRTGKPVKVPSSGWRISDPKRMQEMIEDDRIHFGHDENTVPCLKRHLKDREFQTPYSVFYQDGRAASKRLKKIMGGNLFDYPKDEFILQEIVEMATNGTDIVLDFFAGSSTTAHSVMLQNAADGGNRKFIMVQLDESTNEKSEAYKAGYKTIPAVSRERILRAGKQVSEGECHPDWNRDVGFRALKLDSSNMKDVYYQPQEVEQSDLIDGIDNVKEGRAPEDLLFQVLVDWGVDLALPIRSDTVQDKTVFFVDDDALVACFDSGVTEELVKELAGNEPLRAVFRDSGFASDAVKINVEQIFRQISPRTEVKAI